MRQIRPAFFTVLPVGDGAVKACAAVGTGFLVTCYPFPAAPTNMDAARRRGS
ncbi:MAG: hypothetical protein JXA10_09210 [Anaerolineae bacterium]|nr:hypothetical protein [Anaerolineae bacterium]